MHEKWGLDLSAVAVRVAEYHDYLKGGALLDLNHYDRGSLVTVDVRLVSCVCVCVSVCVCVCICGCFCVDVRYV